MRFFLLIAVLALVPFAASANDAVVVEQRLAFDPEEVTIAPGDKVTFSNKDDVTHNIQITDEDKQTDDRGLQKIGQDISVPFAEAGVYHATCAIHPKMKLTINVKPAAK